MASLFIDSTYDITLGILDDGLGWIQFEKFANQKASAIIQKETFNLLEKSALNIESISTVITVAGPGFYTGLRLSEGFADVFIFNGKKHFSFLSHSIPFLTGIEKGVWMTKAYRGEYFFHLWESEKSKNELVSAKNLEAYLKDVDMSDFYIHSDSAIDELSRQYISHPQTTYDLLKDQSQKIFSSILNTKSKVDSFYFRAPEDEFKVSV